MKIGKFSVTGPLGNGANSSVLQIRRMEDAKAYALKVVPITEEEDKKFLVQAKHEFEIGQRLNHPHLLKVLAYEELRAWFFGKVVKVHLLMEFVNGKPMDQVRLSLPQKVQAFRMIADGMVHMHKKDIFHADLKPGNVMIGAGGVLKVIDFGLAQVRGEGAMRIQGTPQYLAPETAKGKIINERTDIYNFGATMYTTLTGKTLMPWVNDGGEMIKQVTWLKYYKPVQELIKGLPEPLSALIGSCLSIDANQRPERMTAVQNVLSQLEDKLVTSPEVGLDGLQL
jgi:serine/threonine protein kinase